MNQLKLLNLKRIPISLLTNQQDDNQFLLTNFTATFFQGQLLNRFTSFSWGFFRKILFRGVGFKVWRWQSNFNSFLLLDAGCSHFVALRCPPEIVFFFRRGKILLYSQNAIALGNFARQLLLLRPLNCYTNTGFFLADMPSYRKPGKQR